MKMGIVSYFNDPVKIQLFFTGNDHYLQQAKEDIVMINENIIRPNDKNKKVEEKQAWRTNSLSIERIYEAREEELKGLFEIRFNEGKTYKGFITEKRFAEYESKDLRTTQSKYFGWFPILKQWVEYLEDIAGIEHVDSIPVAEPQNIETPEFLNFESFLNGTGKKVIPFLSKTYQSAKPQDAVLMLFALDKLNMLVQGALNNISALSQAVGYFLSKHYTHQSFDHNFKLKDDPSFKAKINAHADKIKTSTAK